MFGGVGLEVRVERGVQWVGGLVGRFVEGWLGEMGRVLGRGDALRRSGRKRDVWWEDGCVLVWCVMWIEVGRSPF